MDLRVYFHMFQWGLCSVFPTVSKTQNWGFDGTGEHCGENNGTWWVKPELVFVINQLNLFLLMVIMQSY